MPRNMSFAETVGQCRAKTKTVTRRKGWLHAHEGDWVWQVVKGMGLKKGETVERIHLIQLTSIRREPLDAITPADVIAEGFPDWTTEDYIRLYIRMNKGDRTQDVTRIEFRYA